MEGTLDTLLQAAMAFEAARDEVVPLLQTVRQRLGDDRPLDGSLDSYVAVLADVEAAVKEFHGDAGIFGARGLAETEECNLQHVQQMTDVLLLTRSYFAFLRHDHSGGGCGVGN